MKIIWKNNALQDLNRIRWFLVKELKLDGSDTKRVIKALKLAPQKLLQFPRMGQLADIVEGEEVRRLLVKGYKVYYKVEADTIVILNVLHSKEDIEGILND